MSSQWCECCEASARELAAARENLERIRSGMAECLTILNIVHRPHPQPELCDACKLLGRNTEEGK